MPAREPASSCRCRSASCRAGCFSCHLQGPGLCAAVRIGRARAARRPCRKSATIEGRPAVRPCRCRHAAAGLDRRGARPRRPRGHRRCVGLCVVVVRAGTAGAGLATHLGIAVDGFVGVNEFVVRNVDTGDRDGTPVVGHHQHRGRRAVPWCSIPARSCGASSARSDIVFRKDKREADRAKVVLVVDDSITTRTLEKEHPGGARLRSAAQRRRAQCARRAAQRPPRHRRLGHRDAACRRLRTGAGDEERPDAIADIPVILVTSRSDDEDREKGLRLGADAYVVKQKFDQNELLRTIRQII